MDPSRNPLKSGQGFNIKFTANSYVRISKVVIPLNRVKVSTEDKMKYTEMSRS